MNIDDSTTELNLSFEQLMLAPIVALLIGTVLIFITAIPYHLGLDNLAGSLTWGILLAIVTFAIVILLTRLPFSTSLREICKKLVPIFDGLPLWKVFTLSLAAGTGEELLFRGFLQQWLAGFMSMEIAILLAALVFGLLHFASLSYFTLTFALGTLFGITYVFSNSLLMIMIWHAVYDMLVMWVFSHRPELLGLKN